MSSSRVAAVAFVVALVLAVATVSYFGGGCPRPLLQEQDPGGMAALVREGGWPIANAQVLVSHSMARRLTMASPKAK